MPIMAAVLAILLCAGLLSAGLKWPTARFGGEPVGAPVFTASSVYVMGVDGRLNIYELAQGTPQRPYDFGKPTHVEPLAFGNTLVIGTDDGRIEAFDREQMQQLWTYPAKPLETKNGQLDNLSNSAESSFSGANKGNETLELRSLVLGGNSVYAVYSNKTIALDATTGHVQRNWTLDDAGPAAADGSRLYVMDGDTLRAFSATGGAGWTLQTGPLFKTYPAVDENAAKVYVATTKGYVMAIRSDSGNVAWQYPLNGWPMVTPLVSGDMVIVGANDGRLRALNRDSGGLRWSTDLGAPVMGRISEVTRGGAKILLVPTQAPSIAAVSAADGALLWNYPLSDWASDVAVSSDSRFGAVATRDRMLYLVILSPMCTIDSPRSLQPIAPFVELNGRAWAWDGVSRVSLTVQGRGQDVTVNQSGPFRTMLDLSGLTEGSVDIRCLADGRDGSSEVDNGPSKSSPILSFTAAQAEMSITAPQAAEPGKTISVYVRNPGAYDMQDVEVEFNGKKQTLSSPFTLTAPMTEGTYNITAIKPGFQTAVTVVRVQADQRMFVGIAVLGVMLVIGLLYFLLTRKKRVAAPTDYSRVQ